MLQKQIKIAPSILSADFSKMGEEIKRIEQSGADLIHCDIMDGVFVPNITFGPKMVADVRKETKLKLDVHLMIAEPHKYIETFFKAGADIITFHAEANSHVRQTLNMIKSFNIQCGIVISPDTPEDAVYDYIDICDMILVMSVYPGFGGQKFIPNALEKIRKIKNKIDLSGKNVDLEVDGGVTLDNIGAITKAGANVIVAGNTIFSSVNPGEIISKLRAQ